MELFNVMFPICLCDYELCKMQLCCIAVRHANETVHNFKASG